MVLGIIFYPSVRQIREEVIVTNVDPKIIITKTALNKLTTLLIVFIVGKKVI